MVGSGSVLRDQPWLRGRNKHRFLTPWKRRLHSGSSWVPPPTSPVGVAWPGEDPQRVGLEGYLPPKSSRLATVTMDSGVRATAQAQGKDTARCRPETTGLLLRWERPARHCRWRVTSARRSRLVAVLQGRSREVWWAGPGEANGQYVQGGAGLAGC